jgi:hypothetical protein
MKVKTLALSAIICGASMLGLNFSTAYAAINLQNEKIEQNIEIEQLSQKVRDRNETIGAVLGIAAIAAIANHNDKHRDDYRHHNDYYRNNHHGRHHMPPPSRHHHGHYR